MRSSEDECDDERDLLNERWLKRREEKPWKIWVASILCLLSGFGLGAVSHRMPISQSLRLHTMGRISKAPFDPDLKVVFQPNKTFEHATPGSEADGVWEELMPQGRGFIQVKASGPSSPNEGSSVNLYETKVVAAFHQMNCLNMLRKSLYSSVTADPTFQDRVPQLEHHWRHCFDYLRQALMCNADTTLEGLDMSKQGILGSVDGWGTEHMCRDWEGMKEWAEAQVGMDHGL